MPDAVIVSALRTPIATAMKGTLRDIDDLILGEGLYGGGVVARHAAITAGLTSVPGHRRRGDVRRWGNGLGERSRGGRFLT